MRTVLHTLLMSTFLLVRVGVGYLLCMSDTHAPPSSRTIFSGTQIHQHATYVLSNGGSVALSTQAHQHLTAASMRPGLLLLYSVGGFTLVCCYFIVKFQ